MEKLVAEAGVVAAKKPNLLEWRVDFFDAIADTAAVVECAARIKRAAGGIPILFTRRSSKEGGQMIALSEEEVVAMYRAVCASGHVEIVDFEMNNDEAHVGQLREFSQAANVQLILSFHDFERTPSMAELKQRFARADEFGADIAKVAVMPQNMNDVLTLLTATLQASEQLRIPVVSMAMGALGAVTRLCGWNFGSAMTFAVGESSSAPGQMPIEDIAAGVKMLRKALG